MDKRTRLRICNGAALPCRFLPLSQVESLQSSKFFILW